MYLSANKYKNILVVTINLYKDLITSITRIGYTTTFGYRKRGNIFVTYRHK